MDSSVKHTWQCKKARVLLQLGNDTVIGTGRDFTEAKYEVFLTMLHSTRYKFTSLPRNVIPGEINNLLPARGHEAVTQSYKVTSCRQYRRLTSNDLSASVCHKLLGTLAQQNNVRINITFPS